MRVSAAASLLRRRGTSSSGTSASTSAILFGYIDSELSDGAKMAVERAAGRIFQLDRRDVFEPENVLAEVKTITRGR